MRVFQSSLLLIIALSFWACEDEPVEEIAMFPDNCPYSSDVSLPDGFQLELLSSNVFGGYVKDHAFPNDAVGYALTSRNFDADSEIFKTTDGGRTWLKKLSDPVRRPRGIFFLNSDVGVATFGYNAGGQMYKTVDGGDTWNILQRANLLGYVDCISKDSEGNLYGVHIPQDRVPEIVTSSDQGDTWSRLGGPNNIHYRESGFCFAIHEDIIFALTKQERIIMLKLDGSTLDYFDVASLSVEAIEVVDLDNIVVSYRDQLAITADRGVSWRQLHDGENSLIYFESPNKGLAILNKGCCLDYDVCYPFDVMGVTDDGGDTWNEGDIVLSNLSGLGAGHLNADGTRTIRYGSTFLLLEE